MTGTHHRKFGAAAWVGCAGLLCSLPMVADTPQDRLQESAQVLSEIMKAPDKGIPRNLLDDAYCAVIVPGVKKGAFIVGGKYGRGFMVCRNEKRGKWGAPAAVRIEGGSIGWQIGGSDSDVVMLVMSPEGKRSLLQSKFTLGGSAEAAAGPVGRSTSADTDARMSAKILTWSRSHGVFAGLSLGGATLREDLDVNQKLYGKRLSNREIANSNIKAPAAAQPLISELNKYSPREDR
ncbi:MAG TPA: lipid-binding SYLF domain-containing protein [Bryobacteraceae bacterium]